jgi:hypothetical protein
VFYQQSDPHDVERVAHHAAQERVEKYNFSFPTFEVWSLQQHLSTPSVPAKPQGNE